MICFHWLLLEGRELLRVRVVVPGWYCLQVLRIPILVRLPWTRRSYGSEVVDQQTIRPTAHRRCVAAAWGGLTLPELPLEAGIQPDLRRHATEACLPVQHPRYVIFTRRAFAVGRPVLACSGTVRFRELLAQVAA